MRNLGSALVGCLLLAGAAAAVIDPNPDRVSFYFDENADLLEMWSFQVTPAYLIVTNPTFPAIRSLECYVDWDESICTFLGLQPAAGGFNLGDQHNVQIGLTEPLATTPATVMATYSFISSNFDIYFSVGAAQPPAIEGDLPVVIDGEDNLFQIEPSFGSGNYCAVLNAHPDPVESGTWGGVKNLYR